MKPAAVSISAPRDKALMKKSAKPLRRSGPRWLETALIYQVYPQSFYDTNGDGVGDIAGVIAKLDYILSLGCNVVWLNPCFDSPFGDAGYDISNFYKVAPRYGTNAELRRLFREARKRGMRVILDLVAGHTSTEHRWFKDSSKAKQNKYSNRYIWTDNAWRGPGTGFDGIRGWPDRDGQYITNFFHFQPALNYGFASPDPLQPWQLSVKHPDAQATRRELLDIMKYWLDRGADGFRVDMAYSLVKNDPTGRETISLWKDFRKFVDENYPEAALLAEWSVPDRAIPAGFHVDFMIHFGTPAYTSLFRAERNRDVFGLMENSDNSFFDKAGKGDIRKFLDIYLKQYQATRKSGYISLPSGNHDISRISLGRTQAELKAIFAFLMTMPGIPCIYNGDEIGMRHITGLPSKEGGYGRTGARTPMQWTSGRNAGFSTAARQNLYLPIDPLPDRPNITSQEKDSGSLLNFIRALSKLRRESEALGPLGEFEPIYAKSGKYPLVYLRRAGQKNYLVVLNPSGLAAKASISSTFGAVQPVNQMVYGVLATKKGRSIRLETAPCSFGIYALIK